MPCTGNEHDGWKRAGTLRYRERASQAVTRRGVVEYDISLTIGQRAGGDRRFLRPLVNGGSEIRRNRTLESEGIHLLESHVARPCIFLRTPDTVIPQTDTLECEAAVAPVGHVL